jgi:hypothetical protein
VHPPGAPVFLLAGRLFSWVAEILSDNPENIAFAVNLMSSLASAFAAMFVAWITMLLGKLILKGREEEPDTSEIIALAGSGLVAGLATAFSTSIWFSAVEGEVYALSTFFTAITLWITVKWYCLPDEPKNDKLLILAIYMTGLSIGVHLLSILTFPAISLFYYFKKTKKSTFLGMAIASVVGLVFVGAVQALIISGIPAIWGWFEILAVNSLGLPFNSGLVILLIFLATIIYGGLTYAFTNGGPVQGLNAAVTYHQYYSHLGSVNFGHEWNASVGRKLAPGVNGLMKFADYTARGFGTDTKKFWLQLEFAY